MLSKSMMRSPAADVIGVSSADGLGAKARAQVAFVMAPERRHQRACAVILLAATQEASKA